MNVTVGTGSSAEPGDVAKARMTTAEPPAPRTPDADDARDGFNLAERIYGDASTNGTANGTHDEGAPTNGNGHSSNGGDGASDFSGIIRMIAEKSEA